MNLIAIKDKAVTTTRDAVAYGKTMTLGDWGSLASICGVALWIWDQRRKKPKKG